MVYVLIEHQSDPDRMMPLRVIEYVVEIYRVQEREWLSEHATTRRLRFDPVLPIVFYTGTRRWESPGRLIDLVKFGELFDQHVPALEPVYINLSQTDPAVLESRGGYFGWTLRLLQDRNSRPAEFRRLLERVIGQLQTMPRSQANRRFDLLSYIHALIYYVRNPRERSQLNGTIERSVRSDPIRQEVAQMKQTIADVLKDEGRAEGVESLQRTLLSQLRQRFGGLPARTSRKIQSTRNLQQLEAWLSQVLTADTVDDLGIE